MIADLIDLDLGPDAATSRRIQNSLEEAWICEDAPAVFMGLMWAYRDCGLDYAEEEAQFLWYLSYYL